MSFSLFYGVQTSEGYLSLSEINDCLMNDIPVAVRSENSNGLIKKINFVGNQKTKILSLEDKSTFECSYNHRFKKLTSNGLDWVCADQLSVGDYILYSSLPAIFPQISLTPHGKYAYFYGKCLSEYGYIPEFINKYSIHDLCMFLSGVFSDCGHINLNKKYNSIGIAFSIYNSNYNVVYYLQRVFYDLGLTARIFYPNNYQCFLRIKDMYSIEKFAQYISISDWISKVRINDYLAYKYSDPDYDRSSRSLMLNDARDLLEKYCAKHGIFNKVFLFRNSKRGDTISLGKFLYVHDTLGYSFEDSPVLNYLYNLKCYTMQIRDISESESECGNIELYNASSYTLNGMIHSC